MALLRPLLLDNVPSIQQSAALALGRLANYSDELAEAVVSNEILPQLVFSLSEQNVSFSGYRINLNFYCSVSTKKPPPTFLGPLPSTHLTLPRPSSTQVHWMPWLTALRSSTLQSRRPQPSPCRALPSTTTSWPKPLSTLVPSVSWSCASRSLS